MARHHKENKEEERPEAGASHVGCWLYSSQPMKTERSRHSEGFGSRLKPRISLPECAQALGEQDTQKGVSSPNASAQLPSLPSHCLLPARRR